ncbi:unnamed protein product, partial [marine sediment metagenome]
MKQTLRNGKNGAISHVLLTVDMGVAIYVTKEAYQKILGVTYQHVQQHYSGTDEAELNALKHDIGNLIVRTEAIESKKLSIALSCGLIKDNDIERK